MLEIQSGDNRVGIYPAIGGAIAYWLKGDCPVFYPVVDSHLVKKSKQIIAAYPLLPYSNRIANGQFTFENRTYQLDTNAINDQDAIHGNAWQREWNLKTFARNSVSLYLEHQPTTELLKKEWPFAYHATLTYKIFENGLLVSISYKNTDSCRQPVGLGFHPYFPKRNPVELGFCAQSVWNNGSNGVPEGRMSIDGKWDFSHMKQLTSETILDNCYAGWDRYAFIRCQQLNMMLTMTASDIFKHLVVFNPEDQPYFTLEPASNMSNAVNMPEISDSGISILKPGQMIKGHIFYSCTSAS